MSNLAALPYVDAVIPFDSDLTLEEIKAVRPDIYTKGGDYAADDLVEGRAVQAQGGRVVILPRLTGYSTTSIIQSRKQKAEGS